MRILFVSEGDAERPFAFSGIANSLVRHLRAHGCSISTVDADLYRWRRLVAGALAWSPNRAAWTSRFRSGDLASWLRTRNATREFNRATGTFDAILQIGATFAPPRAADTPYFLYCDSNKLLGRRVEYSPGAAMRREEYARGVRREKAIYDGAAGIFVLSERVRKSFIEDFHISPDKVQTVFAGPNLALHELPKRRQRSPGAPPTVLFVGREFQRKGGDLLLAAFRNVRQRLPTAELIIVGPEKLSVSDEGVRNLGFLRKDSPDDLARLLSAYQAADVFCLPTRYEPFGIVFVEAMAMELPCIGTNAWAIPEIIVDGETGYLISVNDEQALEDRLFHLLNDPALSQRFGAAGRARMLRLFSWDQVTKKMMDFMSARVGLRPVDILRR